MTGPHTFSRLVARELAVEAAGLEIGTVVPPFVTASVLLAGLGFGPRPDVLSAVGPGLVWLVVLMAAVPVARSVAAAEREEGCWDFLRALVTPGTLLGAKIVALWLWLLGAWLVATLLVAYLLASPPAAAGAPAAALGTLGLSAITVIFGVMLPGAGRRPGLLAVLLLPAALPILLAGTQATTRGTDPNPWLALLAAYAVLVVTVTWATAAVLTEE